MFLVLDFDHMNFECKYCYRLVAVHTFVEGLTLMNCQRLNPLAVAVDKFVEELIELVEGPAELVACFFIAGFWRSIRKFCPSFIKDLL